MAHPAIDALDQAIEKLERERAEREPIADQALITDKKLTMKVDRSSLIHELKFEPLAKSSGLTELGKTIVELHTAGLHALAENQASWPIELIYLDNEKIPQIPTSPQLGQLPQFSSSPTHDEIIRVNAKVFAEFNRLIKAVKAPTKKTFKASNNLVEIEINSDLTLRLVNFTGKAKIAPLSILAEAVEQVLLEALKHGAEGDES